MTHKRILYRLTGLLLAVFVLVAPGWLFDQWTCQRSLVIEEAGQYGASQVRTTTAPKVCLGDHHTTTQSLLETTRLIPRYGGDKRTEWVPFKLNLLLFLLSVTVLRFSNYSLYGFSVVQPAFGYEFASNAP